MHQKLNPRHCHTHKSSLSRQTRVCRTSGIAVGVGLAACEVWESFLHYKDLGTDKGKET